MPSFHSPLSTRPLLRLLLSIPLRLAKRLRLIRDWDIDTDGLFLDTMPSSCPAPCLPWYARRWKAGGAWFLKLGSVTVIIEP